MTATLNGHAPEIAERMLALFKGRDDVLAVPNRKGEGFEPERLSSPLTVERFAKQHLGGAGCLGLYLLRPDAKVFCSAVDFDNKPKTPDPLWREKAVKVYQFLDGAGLSPLLEISQSGNAAHVWMFFSEAIAAWAVRQFWGHVSKRLDVTFVEVYPRQDELTGKALGNLIRFPLFNKSQFVDADWQPLDPIEALDGVRPVDPDEFFGVCRNLGFKLQRPAPGSASDFSAEMGEPSTGGLSRRVVELLSKPGKLKERWGGNVDGLKDQSRSGLVESIATLLVRSYVPTAEIVGALRHWCEASGYEKGLRPDWIKRTVKHAYAFVASKAEPEGEPAVERADKFRIYTSAELDELEFNDQAIIENAKIEGQPGGVFGGTKTLKTCIEVDAAISVASGTNFLGCDFFRVPRARRVLVMSSESGLKALQRLGRRIAGGRGFELSELANLLWCDRVPFIGDDRDCKTIGKIIADNGIEWVFFDPLYQMLDGKEANNIYAQGVQFRRLHETCREHGADFDLLHHTTRSAAKLYEQPTLNDAQWSGISEFVGQWCILGRRGKYQAGSGLHELWLELGARGEFQNCWALDVDEHADQWGRPQGWSVAVRPAAEAQSGESSDKAKQKDQAAEKKLDDDRQAIVNVMVKHPAGETKTFFRDRVPLGNNRFNVVWATLLDDATIVPAGSVKKGNGPTYPTFKLRAESND